MKKVLMVAAPENFRDEELSIPRTILESKGAQVTLASPRGGEIKGMFGATAQAEELAQAAATDHDAVVVVGGAGSPLWLWDNPTLRQIIRAYHAADKPVAAICLSGAALARAGVLSGVEATVFKSEASMQVFRECGVKYREKAVVTAGKIITANGPAAAREFGLAIASALGL